MLLNSASYRLPSFLFFFLFILLLSFPVLVRSSRSLCRHGTISCLHDNLVYDFEPRGNKIGDSMQRSYTKSHELARRKMLQNATAPSSADVLDDRERKAERIDWAIVSTLSFFSAAYALFIYLEWRSLPHVASDDVDPAQIIPSIPTVTRFKYSQVKHMTDAFSFKIGQGGYGVVYKGALSDGTAVAVKMLIETKGTIEEFINEVDSISRTNHVNIVSLLGFCSEGPKRALIYEYMSNGSLEKHLFVHDQPNASAPLTWEQKHKIALGIAKGLEYLHRGCNTRMVHFDIKPHNILLDEDLNPKISDFGLAKLYKDKYSYLSSVLPRGTIGYIAPEVFSRNFGVPSSKSDVYSYGMLVLEMVGGRRNANFGAVNASESYFPHWIYEHLDDECGLQACGVTPGNEEVARKMVLIGLWCIQMNPDSRPSIDRVVDMLEGTAESLAIPPKPYMCSPERSRLNIDVCSSPSSVSSTTSQSQLMGS